MATFNVSNAAQLMSAVRSAGGGDRIVLAGGNYGALDLNGAGRHGLDFGGGVTFASANPGSPAVIKSLNVQSMSNVTFEGLKFDVDGGGSGRPFNVNASSNITFSNTTFEGARVNGYAFGNGLTVTQSSQITVRNSEFSEFKRGMEFRGVNGLDVLANDVHDISGDGMTYAEVRNVLIQGNNLHDMRGDPRSNYHKDFIQFWTTGTKSPTADVVIRGNTLESNDGSTQSIFMANSLAAAGNKSMVWQNILIEKNFIKAGHFHGITVGEANGLTIRDNVVLHDPGASKGTQVNIPRINVEDGSVNVTVTGNTAHEVPSKGGWNVSNNKIVSKGYMTGSPATETPVPDPSGGTPLPEAPAPGTGTQVDMADLLRPQGQAFYAGFAHDAGLTLKMGRGDGGDNLVLIQGASAHAGSGDNILVGNDGRNTLHSGSGDNLLAGLGGPDHFVFTGSNTKGDKTDIVLDLDFREGDKIVLNGFARDTFDDVRGGNALSIRHDGGAVLVDSAADIRELVLASHAVTLGREGGDPVLDVEQNGRSYEIRLDGFDL